MKDNKIKLSQLESFLMKAADILKANADELQTLWLADQLYDMVQGQPMADEALKSVSKKIKKGK